MAGNEVFTRTGFHVNDKVVCVDDTHQCTEVIDAPDGLLSRGQVYCVSGLSDCGGLLLVGHRAVSSKTGKEVGFHPARFCRVDQYHPAVLNEPSEDLHEEEPSGESEPIQFPETEALETPKDLIYRAIDVLEEWHEERGRQSTTAESWLKPDYMPDQGPEHVRTELRNLLNSPERVTYMNHSCTFWLRLVRYHRPTVLFCRTRSPVANVLFHLCMRGNILTEAFLAGEMRERDYPVLTVAVGKLVRAPIRICDARDDETFLSVLRRIATAFEYAFLDWVPSLEELEAARRIADSSKAKFLFPGKSI